MDDARVSRELELVRGFYPEVQYLEDGRWVRLPRYQIPEGVWAIDEVEVCFQVPDSYPGQSPYAFYVQPSLRLIDGSVPDNFEITCATAFAGSWGKFSWIMELWQPTTDPEQGSNLIDFIRSCGYRLREGK